MAATWPSSLPQEPLVSGYTEDQQSQVVRTQTETGPAKQRKRYTTPVETFQMTFRMTDSEVTTFKDFYQNTLGGGSTSFTYTNPRDGSSYTLRFRNAGGKAAYSISAVSALFFDVAITVETV